MIRSKTNRLYLRYNSLFDAEVDNNVDLNSGYNDAADNVKFNFSQEFTLAMLTWVKLFLIKDIKE